MNYEDALIAMRAPQEIIDAARRLDKGYPGYSPLWAALWRKQDEVALSQWYNTTAGQNRYGK